MQSFSRDHSTLADNVTDQKDEGPRRSRRVRQTASAEAQIPSTVLHFHHESVQDRRGKARKGESSAPPTNRKHDVNRTEIFSWQQRAACGAANAPRPHEDSTSLRLINEALEIQANRIACALHDDTGQLLTIVHLILAKARLNASPECAAYLAEIHALFDDIERQLRRFSHDLLPMGLRDFGIIGALEILVEGVIERAGLEIRVTGNQNLRVTQPLETVLYRFVQEALTNVVKHARATVVTIEFRQTDEQVTCIVVDDGMGFKTDDFRPGMGLYGIRQRVQAAAGKFICKSSPGLGAELRVEIPLRLAD